VYFVEATNLWNNVAGSLYPNSGPADEPGAGIAFSHRGRANFLKADLHVEALRPAAFHEAASQKYFWFPKD
jgi:prepilin-type processing-associated H-X9-DG protein